MKISGIANLDTGMSNIEIEGKVTYAKAPRHIEGDNERGHYDFYSQFVYIEDDSGKIGCDISINKEEYKLEQGVVARVKGKLDEYQGTKKIKGKLIAISKGKQETDVQLAVAKEFFDDKAKESIGRQIVETETPSNNVWEAKDLRIARECAVKAVTELVCAKIMKSKDFFNFADSIVKYIYNGAEKEATKEEKLVLARHIAEEKEEQAKPDRKATKADRIKQARDLVEAPGKLELKEGHTGLLEDEELTDEELAEIENAVDEKEEPGSSYNNAHPYKGKKKALRKVSKGEDFIAPVTEVEPGMDVAEVDTY